jgi:hypothetical protein
MRKTILLALSAAALSFGAEAYAMGGGHLAPEASPYAVLTPEAPVPPAVGEGRAAFVGRDPGAAFGRRDRSDDFGRGAYPGANFYLRGQ